MSSFCTDPPAGRPNRTGGMRTRRTTYRRWTQCGHSSARAAWCRRRCSSCAISACADDADAPDVAPDCQEGELLAIGQAEAHATKRPEWRDREGAEGREQVLCTSMSSCASGRSRTLVDRHAITLKVVCVDPALAFGDPDADLSVEQAYADCRLPASPGERLHVRHSGRISGAFPPITHASKKNCDVSSSRRKVTSREAPVR